MSHILIEKILVGYINRKGVEITTIDPIYNRKYGEVGGVLRFNGNESEERFISDQNWGAFERCYSLVSMIYEYIGDDLKDLTLRNTSEHNNSIHLTKGVQLQWKHQVYLNDELYIEKVFNVDEIGGTEEYDKRLEELAHDFLEKYFVE